MTFFRPILSAAASVVALAATPALADVTLPAPYVSRALDAVLLPIDAGVRSAFALGASDSGVLVLATEPGGVADANGILPGDVLSVIGGRKIAKPVDVDTIVYYWIEGGVTDFTWDIYRGGATVEVYTLISGESYWEVIDVTTVESWSVSSESSFSYEEYYSEYSEEITESYESSETLIEETVTSEEFTSEMEESSEEVSEESEETTEESEEVSEQSEDLSEEEVAEDDGSDEMADEAEEESADEEASAEDDMAEDAGDMSDEGANEESYDEGDDSGDEAADEGSDDMADDGGDEGGDEGGDDSGGEE
ncbi:MAG TPA: hypothetical protein VM899_01960 [Rubellimicrobium sp.]|nr:hypothetical protein [Rubellimicrobium sp.]